MNDSTDEIWRAMHSRKIGAMAPPDFPTIVCLCGSTRFYEAFQKANYEETMAGRIVLSVGHYPNSDGKHGEKVGCTPEQKIELDELHKRKIDLADEILVLNVGGYIGESTQSEIAHAVKRGKRIRVDVEEGSEDIVTDRKIPRFAKMTGER